MIRINQQIKKHLISTTTERELDETVLDVGRCNVIMFCFSKCFFFKMFFFKMFFFSKCFFFQNVFFSCLKNISLLLDGRIKGVGNVFSFCFIVIKTSKVYLNVNQFLFHLVSVLQGFQFTSQSQYSLSQFGWKKEQKIYFTKKRRKKINFFSNLWTVWILWSNYYKGLFVCLSICLSIYLFIYLSVCLSVVDQIEILFYVLLSQKLTLFFNDSFFCMFAKYFSGVF